LPARVVASVPMEASAACPEALAPLSRWWDKHSRSTLRLAAMLVWEKERYSAYLDMLPALEDIDVPWRWSEAELSFVSEDIRAKALAKRKTLDEACADLERFGLADKITPDLFLRAQHAVASRAFSGTAAQNGSGAGAGTMLGGAALSILAAVAAAGTGVASLPDAALGGAAAVAACGVAGAAMSSNGDKAMLAVLPMIDQMNHASGMPPDLNFEPTAGRWELRADRDYSAGDEVVISYGAKDNNDLLVQHGFIEAKNREDAVFLPAPWEALPAEVSRQLSDSGVEELRFSRGGVVAGVAAGRRLLSEGEVPESALREAAKVALRTSAVADGFADESTDERIRAEVRPLARAELIVHWRREQRGLLQEAKKLWT